MKLSLNWIKEFVDLPDDLPAEKISYDLTMCTVEVEETISLAEQFEKMYVGKVVKIKSHPEADRLVVVETDLGKEFGTKELVCGGTNLIEGMGVAVAIPGALVNWHGEEKKTELKLAKIRGVESFGMICSSGEIGLSDLYPASEEKEIIDLGDPDAVPGTPLAEYLGYNDIILDIDNKSLTHRPDLWGHYGIARELATIYKCELKPLPTFPLEDISTDGPVKVEIHNTELCHRFTATVVKGVKNELAPLWMRARLASVGQRPINLLADVTNYVMFAMGKPSHAFDLSRIKNGNLYVRDCKKGETLTLLDSSELELKEGTLIVADDSTPLGLAGVMGGLGSGVTEETTDVVFESANFDPIYVRRTASAYDSRTESSTRFEKGLDTESTWNSQNMLLSTLSQIQEGIEVIQQQDVFPVQPEEISVKTTSEFISSRLGEKLSPEAIADVLKRLGFSVTISGSELDVTVPAWRATGDVSIPEDLVEEVGRISGYDDLDVAPIPVKLSGPIHQNWYELDQEVRRFLALRGGLQEVFTYPWVEERFIEACGQLDSEAYELAAPPSPDTARLKTCLIPSLLGVIEKNLRFYDEFGIFEISRIFPTNSNKQPKLLAAATVGRDAKETFLRLKGILGGLFDKLGIDYELPASADETPTWLSKTAGHKIQIEDQFGGFLGLLSKRTLRKAGIERAQAAVFALPVDQLYPLKREVISYTPIPKFPHIEYDLAVLFGTDVHWGSISDIVANSSDYIKEVVFVDEYTGKQVPAGKKSIAFKLVLGDDKATMTSEQAQEIADATLANLAKELGGELRAS